MATVTQQRLPDRTAVALWQWSLLAEPSDIQALWRVLSVEEQARAERFHFPRDRRRYVVGRATLRTRLAGYLGCPAQAVGFCYGKFGKPALADREWRSRLSFNLSHADDLAVLAVAGGAAVGVDIERIRPLTDEFAQYSFAAEELAELRALPEQRREAAMFACWTRREAYVKAIGAGLSCSTESFAVSVDPSSPARLLRVDAGPAEAWQWTLTGLTVHPGYAAALAIRQPACNLQWRLAS